MEIEVKRRAADELFPQHELFRAEANCQLIRDSFWTRGFLVAYAIELDGRLAGHGAIGNRHFEGRVIEFFTLPEYRRHAGAMFERLLAASGATHIEAQTNVPLMATMLRNFATEIHAENILFAEGGSTELPGPEGAVFRHVREDGELAIFEHHHEPGGDWVIEAGGEIVATGGFLTHYNPPYADLYMEVAESKRRRGFGSYLIQELKRVCYEAGKMPAARCDVANVASRRTLERGGLAVCGEIVVGRVSAERS
jgi:GNAT superfamily N-acetyltransferase